MCEDIGGHLEGGLPQSSEAFSCLPPDRVFPAVVWATFDEMFMLLS